MKTGEKWKTVRAMLSPLFTTSKLKAMTTVIESHAKEYCQDIISECELHGRIKYDCKKYDYICSMIITLVASIKIAKKVNLQIFINNAPGDFRRILSTCLPELLLGFN